MIIGDILKERIERYEKHGALVFQLESKEYRKKWNDAVKCFQTRLNKDRINEGLKPLGFMPIRIKLLALQEIDDLRWFYYHCQKYSKTKDSQENQNTFSRCFFGALKIK